MWYFLACSGISPNPDVIVEKSKAPPESAVLKESEPEDAGLKLCINEFMPDNHGVLVSDSGATKDWIELHNPGNDYVEIRGWSLSDDLSEPRKGVIEGQPLYPGEFRVLSFETDGLDFALSSDGGDVGLYDATGRGSIIHYGPVPEDFSVARRTDCCTGSDCLGLVFGGTPGTTNDPDSQIRQDWVGAASTWKYWDQGSYPGDSWKEAGFDDSGWPSGVGPLGYGDSWFATTIGYGGNADLKYVTTWFRLKFDVSYETKPKQLELGILHDDGAVIYLNGGEIDRVGMADGSVTPETLASTSMGGAGEAARWVRLVDAWAIQEGTNVLAVEVHQAAQNSSDLGFDLSVTGIW
jgi:hypothetical protein